jgi:cytochrome b pre-mRNA-processing protein 3
MEQDMSPLTALRKLLRPSPETLAARNLLAWVIKEGRKPGYFVEGGVADTVDGRFDLMVLQLFLMLRRLKAEGQAGNEMGQRLLDAAFAHLDEALREMGVGDLSVPKKMKAMAEAYQGRAMAYEKALESGNPDSFAEALKRNLYRHGEVSQSALAWTRAEALRVAERLAAMPGAGLVGGEIPAGA